MERYEVLEQLPPGALGTMLVVALKAEESPRKKYVMKQVECIEEKQANKALKEAMDLLKLRHPNICIYKELFVTWDNKSRLNILKKIYGSESITWQDQISSLFLCLVMQHSGQGDLSSLIKEKRQKSEKITDKVILKFLGQMVDALFYIHEQNIIHRNLKPSNILVTDEVSFMLCDFSTEALMTDEMKWKIRVEENSKSWMAPETLSFSFSEKSDIWSLGCILLDMMTCCVLNTEEITSLLRDIRNDTSYLEGLLTLMENGDSSFLPLFTVVFMMLHIEPSMRPTAKALTDFPLVKECLTDAGSFLIKPKEPLPLNILDVLLEGGVSSVPEFMNAYWDREEAQVKAVEYLAGFLGDKKALPCLLACTGLITSAMKTHIDCLKLQRDGCRLLLEILSQALECNLDVEGSLDDSVISSLLETLRNYSENEELLSLVCTLLMMISSSEVAAENIRKAGAIPDLLMSIRQFLHNAQICLACCGALWSLLVSGNLETSIDKAALKNALSASSAVLQEHVQNGAVTEAACSAIWALSLQGCFTENESESTTALLLDALRMNLGRSVLVKNACQALANLLRLSEISAFRFVTDSKANGIKLIKDAYNFHRDDPEVVESVCALVNEMVQYDDIALDLVSQNMKEMLSEIKSRFPSSTEIMVLVDATLLKLQK